MFKSIKKFIKLADATKLICDSEASWEVKYDIIFSEEIIGAVRKTGIEVDWYDPDMDYRDDVMAYVEALTYKANELKKLPLSLEED